jgi:hypothetical protein
MPEESKNKQQIISYALFAAILLVLFGITLLFTIIARKSWNNGLREQVQLTLNKNQLSDCIVGKEIPLDSAIITSCNAFDVSVKGKKNSDTQKAVIIKITTMYGPMPAVYLYDNGTEAKFIDFASFEGKAVKQIKDMSLNSQIAYWGKRIPSILSSKPKNSAEGTK